MSYPQTGPGYPAQPYGQPPQPYGHPGYQPGYPGYSAYGPDAGDDRDRANPAAGILLLIGALAGLAAVLIPVEGSNDLPIVAAFKLFDEAGETIPLSTGLMAAFSWISLALGSLLALIAGLLMFRRSLHGGSAATGLLGALLMLASPILMYVASEGHMFDGSLQLNTILAVGAWLPALIGALIGFRK